MGSISEWTSGAYQCKPSSDAYMDKYKWNRDAYQPRQWGDGCWNAQLSQSSQNQSSQNQSSQNQFMQWGKVSGSYMDQFQQNNETHQSRHCFEGCWNTGSLQSSENTVRVSRRSDIWFKNSQPVQSSLSDVDDVDKNTSSISSRSDMWLSNVLPTGASHRTNDFSHAGAANVSNTWSSNTTQAADNVGIYNSYSLWSSSIYKNTCKANYGDDLWSSNARVLLPQVGSRNGLGTSTYSGYTSWSTTTDDEKEKDNECNSRSPHCSVGSADYIPLSTTEDDLKVYQMSRQSSPRVIRRERRFSVSKPLYQQLMRQRLLSKSNRFYHFCCPRRCFYRWI